MARARRALISVYDKTGVEELARGLVELGFEILSTGGTRRLLESADVPVLGVSDYTGFPEMMGGRVKTLHPKVHGGILALRDEPGHVEAMSANGIEPIDLVVVNLYPFKATIEKPGVSREEAIEQIDIGGPTMVRAAAKNHRYVGIVTDPGDYGRALEGLRAGNGTLEEGLLREFATKAFGHTAEYDAAIHAWMSTGETATGETALPRTMTVSGSLEATLRYGENPHQTAGFYRVSGDDAPGVGNARVLNGKALSYNNLVDLNAAFGVAEEFARPFACVVKHNNPCGAAEGADLATALEQAWAGDPLSAFGSVLAMTRPVDLATAEFLVSENRFVEAIIAPQFDEDAFTLLTTGPKWGKNVRLLASGPFGPTGGESGLEVRPIGGGLLVQDRDSVVENPEDCEVVTRTAPLPEQIESLLFAARIAKHVKSNAITLAAGTRILGVGAGQMSRVDSVGLAIAKAGGEVEGSVLASDAFFPFPDGVELAMDAGVRAILQPGGSIRDDKVIAACDERGVAMLFTGRRHFRH